MDYALIYHKEEPTKSDPRRYKSLNTPWPVEGKSVFRHLRERWVVRLKKIYSDQAIEAPKVKIPEPQTWYSVNRARDEFVPSLPPGISSVLDVIRAARAEIPSDDNWDEQGSPGYSESTWHRVEKFLIGNALHFLRRHRTCFPPPEISPGPNGSIDLFWRTNKRELLINVPADFQRLPSYYGDDREEGTENAIRGKKMNESADNDWIFLWLTK